MKDRARYARAAVRGRREHWQAVKAWERLMPGVPPLDTFRPAVTVEPLQRPRYMRGMRFIAHGALFEFTTQRYGWRFRAWPWERKLSPRWVASRWRRVGQW